MKYVFVPFDTQAPPKQFSDDITQMGATLVTPRLGPTLAKLQRGDELCVMGHCGPGLDKLYTAPTGLCAEVGVKAIVGRLGERGLPQNWEKITLIACCAAADASADLPRATSFANRLQQELFSNHYKKARVIASMHKVKVMGGKPVEVGTVEGKVIAADFANHRAPLVPWHQSGARPAGAGPSSPGSGSPRPGGGSGKRPVR